MQQTATWNFPPAGRLSELLELFGCPDVVAPVDANAFGKRAGDLIRQAVRGQITRYEQEGTADFLFSVLQNAPSSDRHTMVAAAAASASLLIVGAGAALLG
jgi:hypothetical protein